jgi:hypothetical protein
MIAQANTIGVLHLEFGRAGCREMSERKVTKDSSPIPTCMTVHFRCALMRFISRFVCCAFVGFLARASVARCPPAGLSQR